MKTAKQFSMMMAVILLSFSIYSCDPQPNLTKHHTITLYVDTGSINQQNIDSTCSFKQDKGVSNKDFTTVVHLGDDITWVGVSSSGDDKVRIKKIKYVSDAEILNSKEINNALFSKKVHGKVNKGKEGDIEKYSIEIKIKGNNEKFIIDPKLQVGGTH